MHDCYLSEQVNKDRADLDGAFMGRTHATSAVAIFLMGVAFFPLVTEQLLGTDNIWLVVLAAIATAGASLLPDLDNTSSTSRNSLGPVGHIASEAFRVISTVVQTTIRTARDDAEPNPHRGFFHTIPASALVGAAIYFTTKMSGNVELPILGEMTYGHLMALLFSFMLFHLAVSGLAKPFMKKLGKQSVLGEGTTFLFSFAVVAAIFTQLPETVTYEWLGMAVFVGCVIHILGDAFTTSGVPILFPIPRKGKMWWMVRLTSIKAGGVVENVLFVPFFTLLIMVSALRIFGIF